MVQGRVMDDVIDEAIAADATVNSMIRCGESLEQIVVELVRQKRELQGRLQYLIDIAPFKITTADGRELIWRCPDHLVPDQGAYPFIPTSR